MSTISDAQMDARLERMRPYTMVMLKVGPAYQPPDVRSSGQAAIVREHGRRNMALREDGTMPLVGPVADARPLVGICILSVDADETRTIMDADPAVEAGIFVYEIATWFAVPGDALPASA